MIKKTITYAGFDGDVTEDFYFNMTKAELTEKELVYPGGFANHLQRIVEEDDRPAIIAAFKDLILSSVGTRGEDNRFHKKGVGEDFEATEAFSALFMELVTDAAKSAEFFNGVMPKDLAAKMQEVELPGALKALSPSTIELPEAPVARKPEEYSYNELVNMPYAEFDQLMKKADFQRLDKLVLALAMQRKMSGK